MPVRPDSTVCASLHTCALRPGPAGADCDSTRFLRGNSAVVGFACLQVALCALAALRARRCIQVLSGPGLLAQTATALVSLGVTVLLPVVRACNVALCALTDLSVHRCIHGLSGPGLLAQTATALVSLGDTVLSQVLRAHTSQGFQRCLVRSLT